MGPREKAVMVVLWAAGLAVVFIVAMAIIQFTPLCETDGALRSVC